MFSFTTINDYHNNLTENNYSCKDAVIYYLSNIKKNERLNAFVEVYEKEALKKAAELDELRLKKTADPD